jgi:hypothetical protein
MPTSVKIAWAIAITLMFVGIAPVAIAMLGSHISPAFGPIGYLGIVTLPLALIGACLVPVIALWSLVVWLRR